MISHEYTIFIYITSKHLCNIPVMIIFLVVFIYIGMGFRDTGLAINELLLILWIRIGVICVYRHSCFCSYIN